MGWQTMAENGMAEAGISTKQQQAILALLSTKSVAAAAQQAKVGERTLHRWLTDAAFRAALTQAESDLLDEATRRLLQLQGTAIETIEGILDDADASTTVRLRAAQTVLDHLLKLREIRDIELRLAALEEQVTKG